MKMYSFPSQYVVMFYLSYRSTLMCRSCYFTEYFLWNDQRQRWNYLDNCCLSMVPGVSLIDCIHKVSGFGQVHPVSFFLHAQFHTFSWFVARWCNHCEYCTWDCMQLLIPVESWIPGSLYTMIYPWNHWGKNIWCPCIYIEMWCRRLRCLHAVSL